MIKATLTAPDTVTIDCTVAEAERIAVLLRENAFTHLNMIGTEASIHAAKQDMEFARSVSAQIVKATQPAPPKPAD